MKQKKKIKKKLYPTAFLLFGFIAIMTAADLVNPVRTFSEMENRELKTSSRFTFSRVISGDFQERYEEVLADQFAGRDEWISIKSEMESLLLKTENNGILYGKNGALFGKLTSYDKDQLSKNLEFIKEFASEKENVLFGIIPSSYVYSQDQLPLGSGQIDEQQIISEITKETESELNWIDIDSLLTEMNSEELYYQTDHHWKGTTAFEVYKAICKKIGITSFNENDLILKTTEGFYGSYYSKCKKVGTTPDTLLFYDLPYTVNTTIDGEEKANWYNKEQLSARDKYGALLYGNSGLTVLKKSESETENPSRILLIKDSFSNAMAQLFLSSFDEVYIVDLRSYPSGMTALCEEKNFDQILILYNFENLESDTNVYRIMQ